jgi:hypothetical protein
MSLYKDASLVMIPSAVKDGKLYSIRPTDGSGDFTFSRGSNLAATRVDVNGLIEKGRENLLLYSNEFSNGNWSKTNQTTLISNNANAPDGTLTASTLNFVNAGGSDQFYQSATTNAGVYNTSVWLRSTTGSNQSFYFGFYDNDYDNKIITITPTWTRFEHFGNLNAASTRFCWLYPTITNASIEIWNAQGEQGLVATDYIETGASTAQAGILEDLPRLDYSGGASCPALLLEPQRTNLLPHSEYIGSSVWTKDLSAVINNATTSPEGVNNASLLYSTSSSSAKWGSGAYDFNSATNDTYTNTIYVKPNNWRWVYMIDPSGLKNVWFDLENGVTGTAESPATSSIEDVGNGWFKCVVSSNILTTYTYTGIYFSDSDNSYVCTANGTNGAYVYGFQSEAGSYPTSYIPTYGSAVTRSQDTGSLNLVGAGVNDGWISGTILIEFEKPYNNENADAIRIHGNSVTGRAYIYNNGYGFASDFSYSSNFTIGDNNKIIYRLNTLSTANLFKNGVKLTGAEGSGTAWSDIKYIYLNNQGGAKINIKQIVVFPTALTDSECIALTTL